MYKITSKPLSIFLVFISILKRNIFCIFEYNIFVLKQITRQLIEKSQEAIILAIELYNKPTIKYRIEGFCFFYTNSWELLLKAKIIEDNKNENVIYYRKERGAIRRTLTLRDCIFKVFPNENDAVRKNIESVSDIRDTATHFIIEELERIYSGLFQAGIINYIDQLNKWFKFDITDKCSPALMTLVGDLKDINPTIIKKKYGSTILDFFTQQEKTLNTIGNKLDSTKFRIPIEYKLVLTKKEGDADIRLGVSDTGVENAIILEVSKNPDSTHPYQQKDILEKLNKKFKTKQKLNTRDIQAIIHFEKIKGNNKYHFQIARPHVNKYSDALIEFIAVKIERDDQYLSKARIKYSRFIAQKKLK